MKFKTTRKFVKANAVHPIALHTAGTYLLSCVNPVAYVAGELGWDFDVYEVDGVTITTGYRHCVGTPADPELVDKCERWAYEISSDNTMTYEQRKEGIRFVLSRFISAELEHQKKAMV